MNAVIGTLGSVRQLGHVVEDIDAAVALWTGKLGVGPWTIIRNIALPSTFRGQATEPLIDIALAYHGELQIELIRQRNGAASPYRAFIDQRRFGLHHVAFLSEQIHAQVEQMQQAGLELVFDINMPTGGRYAYFASPVPGEQTFIEVLEATPVMKDMFRQGMAAAKDWDGSGKSVVIDFASMGKR